MEIQKQSFSLDDFEPIPEPRRRFSSSAVNISPSGHVSLNKYLREEILKHTECLKLGFSIHKRDQRILLLRVTEEPNYTFNADGGKTDKELSRRLVNSGVSLPARYEVAWDDRLSGWIGVLDGELVPDARERSLEAAKRRQKNVRT